MRHRSAPDWPHDPWGEYRQSPSRTCHASAGHPCAPARVARARSESAPCSCPCPRYRSQRASYQRLTAGNESGRAITPRVTATTERFKFRESLTVARSGSLAAIVLANSVAGMRQLSRRRCIFGRTITVKVKFADFRQVTRSRSFSASVAGHDLLRQASVELVRTLLPSAKGIRLLRAVFRPLRKPTELCSVEILAQGIGTDLRTSFVRHPESDSRRLGNP
jgi:impB/mucB/samB family protein